MSQALQGGVRLKFSGIMTYIANMTTLLVNISFTIILTRKLTVEDYGLWQVIGALASYFLTWIPITYTYWITRDVARGDYDSARTGTVVSLLLGTTSSICYIVISMIFIERLSSSLWYFGLYSIAVLITFCYTPYQATAWGIKPEHIGFSEIVSTIVKVIIGYFLIVTIGLGLYGAILAFMGYSFSKYLYYRAKIGKILQLGNVKAKIVKKWLSKAWIPLSNTVAHSLVQLDIAVVALVTASTIPLAYYRVVQFYSQLLWNTITISIGMYPLLLSSTEERASKILKESINLVALIALPMATGIFVMAEHLLALLRVDYVVNSHAVRLGVVYAILMITVSIVYRTLIGMGKVDVDIKATFRDYLKSTLFTAAIGRLIIPATVLPALFFASLIFAFKPVELVIYWYIFYIVGYAAYLLYLIRLAKVNKLAIKVDFKTLTAMVISSIVMGLLLSIFSGMIEVSEKFVVEVYNLLMLFLLGSSSYFSLLYATCGWFRSFLKDALAFLKHWRQSRSIN